MLFGFDIAIITGAGPFILRAFALGDLGLGWAFSSLLFGCVVGSFPAWSALKGPIRKLRYEWIGDCPIFNYTRRELELMLGATGFERVEIDSPGRSGFLVRAYRA